MSNGAGDVDRTDEVDSGAIVRTFLIADVRGYTSFTQSHGDEPESYYPTGVRNYARVIAPEDSHAASGAVLAKELGLRRLFVLKSTDEASDAFATQFKRTARKLDLTLAGSAEWEPDAKTYSAQAEQVARARPAGIYFPDLFFENPNAVLDALRAQLGEDIVLITNDFSYAAPGMYVTTTGRARRHLSAVRSKLASCPS